MRFANVGGRMCLAMSNGVVDVASLTEGQIPAEPAAFYDRWPEAVATLRDVADAPATSTATKFGAPSPQPRQIFAVAVNYPAHADETDTARPEAPLVFTKFWSCLSVPGGSLKLPSDYVDWEVELVVVIGRRAEHVPDEQAWSYVAGLTVGQDFTDRSIQMVGPLPQFSLGKSFPHFGPTGPFLVTIDEIETPNDLVLKTTINGETMQHARTSQMIFGVPRLIAYISSICPLLPGDLIFTGTPAGVGFSRQPPRYLRAGDEVTSSIDGVGSFVTVCTA